MKETLTSSGIEVHRVVRNFTPASDLRQSVERDNELLFYSGMLEYHKGPLELVDAFHLSRNRQGFKLYISGDGRIRNVIQERIELLNLQDRVILTGFLSHSDLAALRSRAGIQVVPSQWYENAPLVVLEAFSMGLPVLGSDLGGLPELLTPDSGSRIYRGGDVVSLANSLVSLWEERDRLATFGEKARRTYEERFTPDIHYQAYMDVLK